MFATADGRFFGASCVTGAGRETRIALQPLVISFCRKLLTGVGEGGPVVSVDTVEVDTSEVDGDDIREYVNVEESDDSESESDNEVFRG